jgi:hypothetical protein
MPEPRKDKPIFAEFWYRLYPEWRYLQSREERREVKRLFGKRPRVFIQTMALVIPMALAVALMSAVVTRWLTWFGLSIQLASVINALFWAVAGGLSTVYLFHRPYIRFLRQYLQDQGVPICLKCGYDLKGQIESRCSECGQEFDPKLLRTGDQTQAE